MPGRKKGRQRGNSGSKAQRARRWDDALRDARDDLASDRRAKLVRGGDSAPPRLSVQGYRSLATLLTQRVRADREDENATQVATIASRAGVTQAAPRRVADMGTKASFWGAATPNKDDADGTSNNERLRRKRTLLSLCISQIGRDFLEYRSDEQGVAEAFRLLPDSCLSRLSRAASASGTVADHNLALLCGAGVRSLWLRGRFSDQGAHALLPALHASSEKAEGSHLADDTYDKAEDSSHCEKIQTSVVREDGGVSSIGGVDGAEEWETADERIQASLSGGVSLTSLDVSSPIVTSRFVKRLVVRIPTLRRLGLRGSLDVVGGPNAVCDHVPRLSALRELDVSHCSWFCDLCLRRFANALARGRSSAGHTATLSEESSVTLERMTLDHVDETTRDWGAASTRHLHSDTLALRSGGVVMPETTLTGTGVSWPSGLEIVSSMEAGNTTHSIEGAPRFRTFTLVCANTSVTEKGARCAEAIAPGLWVVLVDKPG